MVGVLRGATKSTFNFPDIQYHHYYCESRHGDHSCDACKRDQFPRKKKKYGLGRTHFVKRNAVTHCIWCSPTTETEPSFSNRVQRAFHRTQSAQPPAEGSNKKNTINQGWFREHWTYNSKWYAEVVNDLSSVSRTPMGRDSQFDCDEQSPQN